MGAGSTSCGRRWRFRLTCGEGGGYSGCIGTYGGHIGAYVDVWGFYGDILGVFGDIWGGRWGHKGFRAHQLRQDIKIQPPLR